MFVYVLPNLGIFHHKRGYLRGSLQERYTKLTQINRKLNSDAFSLVEIPGNYIKGQEAPLLGLSKSSLLTPKSAHLLYAPTNKHLPNVGYVLHTEPCFPPSNALKWYDSKWISAFIEHIESISYIIGRDNLYAIEIHPGLPQGNLNNSKCLAKATIRIIKHFKRTAVLLENRAGGHIIGSGTHIRKFCEDLKEQGGRDVFESFGFAMDFQQLYKYCEDNDLDFAEQLKFVPINVIKAMHIHSLRGKARSHQPPSKDDPIDWSSVRKCIVDKIQEQDITVLVLPEVHNEKAIVSTMEFCKKYLNL